MRSKPWRQRCPAVVEERLRQLDGSGLLVVQQPGPTSFVLKAEADRRKFKVTVGDPQTCSACNIARGDLCVHVLFVLVKVFRVPPENNVVWQLALLEAEVEQLVSGRLQRQRTRAPAPAAASATTIVTRRPVEADDVCPICCDDLDDARPLVFCRSGCGGNVHHQCFRQYAQHNSTNPSPLLCPLCRAKWGPLTDQPASHGVSCSECRVPIAGERYRCAFCRNYNLCGRCIARPLLHRQHPFDVAAAPGQPFAHATRPAPDPAAGQGRALGLPEAAAAVDPAALELMQRSLGPEDYERLAALDDAVPAPRGSVLTEAEVCRLPRSDWGPEAGVDECAVCMEVFRLGEVLVRLSCGHLFHAPCALRWLTECRGVCPIDNIPVAVPDAAPAPAPPRPKQRAPRSAPQDTDRRRPPPRAPGPPAGLPGSSLRAAPPRAPGIETGGSYQPSAGDLAGLVVGGSASGRPPPASAPRQAPSLGAPGHRRGAPPADANFAVGGRGLRLMAQQRRM